MAKSRTNANREVIQPEIKTTEGVEINALQATLIAELNAIDQAATAVAADDFSGFDDIEIETLPDEGVYELRFTAVKPLPRQQVEIHMASSDDSIQIKFTWFGNMLTQNLPRLKALYKDQEFAKATTGALLKGLVGNTAKLQVKYNGAFINYNIV